MTHAVSRRLTEKKISTHTPARGVTLPGTHRNWPDPVFQPTLPRGEWQCILRRCFYEIYISTHTPARGVTVKQTIFLLNIFLFFTQFTSFFHQTSPYFHFISFFTQNPGANLPVVLMSLLIRTWYALLTANMSHFYQKISCFSEAISKYIKTAFYAIAAFSLNHFLENTG